MNRSIDRLDEATINYIVGQFLFPQFRQIGTFAASRKF